MDLSTCRNGEKGKRVIRLERTLIIPNISVNLFSLQRVITKGYLPVYKEVKNKCLIKRKTENFGMVQVATLSIKNGRVTLDCKLVDIPTRSSGPALQIDTFKVELDM